METDMTNYIRIFRDPLNRQAHQTVNKELVINVIRMKINQKNKKMEKETDNKKNLSVVTT